MQTSFPVYEPLSVVADHDNVAPMCTLTLHIPRFYNPDERGRRKKCELSKLKLTLREMRHLFSGYSVLSTKGWNREDRVRDTHYRCEMDFFATPDQLGKIRLWKLALEVRFEQHSIYMRLSERTSWL